MNFYVGMQSNVPVGYFKSEKSILGPFFSKETSRMVLLESIKYVHNLDSESVTSLLKIIRKSSLLLRRPAWDMSLIIVLHKVDNLKILINLNHRIEQADQTNINAPFGYA
ncbi:hypothetical protein HN800_01145 [bacterium]|nr:hypothetical protein [bacterium]MBT4495784.1 hypothetical protein [bacterium]MBT4763681.1 hypothetical protein [bacterium]MBT5401052.1 hypothetical protein [bacterium]MBT6067534.1 hypothetical protein [bacterium]